LQGRPAEGRPATLLLRTNRRGRARPGHRPRTAMARGLSRIGNPTGCHTVRDNMMRLRIEYPASMGGGRRRPFHILIGGLR
jgi:hypothetical protein